MCYGIFELKFLKSFLHEIFEKILKNCCEIEIFEFSKKLYNTQWYPNVDVFWSFYWLKCYILYNFMVIVWSNKKNWRAKVTLNSAFSWILLCTIFKQVLHNYLKHIEIWIRAVSLVPLQGGGCIKTVLFLWLYLF